MRFRPANIRLINRRSNLPRLLLALSSKGNKNNDNDKSNPTGSQELTGSLHIRFIQEQTGFGVRYGPLRRIKIVRSKRLFFLDAKCIYNP